MDNYNYCLKTDNGKIVTVNEQIALCAVDIQNAKKNGQRVRVKENPKTQKKQMAFIFPYENENYLAVVEGGTLKLEKDSSIQESLTLPKRYWFEKVNLNGSDLFSLQSVVKPSLYVCGPLEGDAPFFLSLDNGKFVLFKDEEM